MEGSSKAFLKSSSFELISASKINSSAEASDLLSSPSSFFYY